MSTMIPPCLFTINATVTPVFSSLFVHIFDDDTTKEDLCLLSSSRSHGPLVTNPNVSVKRHVRSKVVGTIMKAVGQQK